MLKRSFIMIPGIGERTERNLWANDIRTWEMFLETDEIPGMGTNRKRMGDRLLNEGLNKLEAWELAYFSNLFKPRDAWRLWSEFGKRAVYLDIETLGTRRDSPITVVGVHDGYRFDASVRGFNLNRDRIRKMLDGTSMIVTFNGTTFDLPLIEHQFPGSLPKIPHLDLRFAAGLIGLRGGLKSIEIQCGISRPDDVAGMSGEDAVRLWRVYERGNNRNALKLILKYNKEDIVNLIPLTRLIVDELERRTLHVRDPEGSK